MSLARTLPLTIFLLFFINLTFAATPPIAAFKARYDVYVGFIKVGEASRELVWNPNPPHEYRSSMSATGLTKLFLQKSVKRITLFNIEKKHVFPLSYHYEDTKGITVDQQFDWANNRVSSDYKDKLWTYSTPPGTQDQNLYQIALMLDVAAGERDKTYQLAENKKLTPYKIKYIATEKVDTPWGKFDAIVMQNTQQKQQTTLWCAPAFKYLPIKIRHRESGLSFTAELKELSGFPLPRH